MRVDLFDFELPDERIALRPAEPRDSARLLAVRPEDTLEDRLIRDLPDLLQTGDMLVFNDTRVIPARLTGTRARGDAVARVEATLHMRTGPDRWRAFVKPGKRLKVGDRVCFGSDSDLCLSGALNAEVAEKGADGEFLLVFDFSGAALDQALQTIGHMPLPPYIASKRGEDSRDRSDYQTIYARSDGAVAAPTAGLHFTPELLDALKARGIEQCFVTLHVGAGTFLPVKADDTADHKMHAEIGEVDAAAASAINATRARGGRVICVGTTSLRLLESAAADDGSLSAWSGATDIFITPGYRFKLADMLLTNFHLPRSTLFMLVSAFSGLDSMQSAYRHAIASGYRFYSYGDACLLSRSAS